MGLFNGSLICHGQPATQGALLFAEGHVPQYTAGSGTPSSTRMTALKNTYQLFRMLDFLKYQGGVRLENLVLNALFDIELLLSSCRICKARMF